jgi:hypothetical protein
MCRMPRGLLDTGLHIVTPQHGHGLLILRCFQLHASFRNNYISGTDGPERPVSLRTRFIYMPDIP